MCVRIREFVINLQINHQAGHFGIQDQECDNSSGWPIGFCLLADNKTKKKLYLPDLPFLFFPELKFQVCCPFLSSSTTSFLFSS